MHLAMNNDSLHRYPRQTSVHPEDSGRYSVPTISISVKPVQIAAWYGRRRSPHLDKSDGAQFGDQLGGNVVCPPSAALVRERPAISRTNRDSIDL